MKKILKIEQKNNLKGNVNKKPLIWKEIFRENTFNFSKYSKRYSLSLSSLDARGFKQLMKNQVYYVNSLCSSHINMMNNQKAILI
jgi:hypothetical protein